MLLAHCSLTGVLLAALSASRAQADYHIFDNYEDPPASEQLVCSRLIFGERITVAQVIEASDGLPQETGLIDYGWRYNPRRALFQGNPQTGYVPRGGHLVPDHHTDTTGEVHVTVHIVGFPRDLYREIQPSAILDRVGWVTKKCVIDLGGIGGFMTYGAERALEHPRSVTTPQGSFLAISISTEDKRRTAAEKVEYMSWQAVSRSLKENPDNTDPEARVRLSEAERLDTYLQKGTPRRPWWHTTPWYVSRRGLTCNATEYPRPDQASCQQALSQLPAGEMQLAKESVPIIVLAGAMNASCAIMIRSQRRAAFVSTEDIVHAAQTVMSNCSSGGQGDPSGGVIDRHSVPLPNGVTVAVMSGPDI